MHLFKTWKFAWWEVSLLKVGLISFGILLGLYFYDYLRDLLWLWWILFLLSALYFIVRMAREEA